MQFTGFTIYKKGNLISLSIADDGAAVLEQNIYGTVLDSYWFAEDFESDSDSDDLSLSLNIRDNVSLYYLAKTIYKHLKKLNINSIIISVGSWGLSNKNKDVSEVIFFAELIKLDDKKIIEGIKFNAARSKLINNNDFIQLTNSINKNKFKPKEIDLDNCNVLPKNIETLMSSLADNSESIEKISLKENFVGDEKGIKAIAKLCERAKKLTRLDLTDCGMSDKSMLLLTQSLEKTKGYPELHVKLMNNDISDTSLEYWGALFKKKERSFSLNLRNNQQIEDAGYLIIADTISNNGTLTRLIANNVSNKSLIAILKAAKKNTKLTKCVLECSAIENEQINNIIEEVISLITENNTLISISLGDNNQLNCKLENKSLELTLSEKQAIALLTAPEKTKCLQHLALKISNNIKEVTEDDLLTALINFRIKTKIDFCTLTSENIVFKNNTLKVIVNQEQTMNLFKSFEKIKYLNGITLTIPDEKNNEDQTNFYATLIQLINENKVFTQSKSLDKLNCLRTFVLENSNTINEDILEKLITALIKLRKKMTIQSLSLNTKNINFKLSKESFELEATVSLEQAINLLNSSEKIICFNKITLNVSDVKSTKDQKFLCDALIQFINKNKTLTQFELSFTNDIHFSKNQSMNILSAYEDNKFLMNFKLPVHEKLVDERSKIELEKLKSSYLENEKFKINIYGFFEKLNEKTKKLNTVKEIDVKKLEKSIEKLDKEYVDLENSFNSLTLDSKMKNELNEQLMNAKNKIGIFKECKKDRQFTLKEKEITNVMTKNSLNN